MPENIQLFQLVAAEKKRGERGKKNKNFPHLDQKRTTPPPPSVPDQTFHIPSFMTASGVLLVHYFTLKLNSNVLRPGGLFYLTLFFINRHFESLAMYDPARRKFPLCPAVLNTASQLGHFRLLPLCKL